MESLLNKVAGLQAYNLIKKIFQWKYFLVNMAKFLRTIFVGKKVWWLLRLENHLLTRSLTKHFILKINKFYKTRQSHYFLNHLCECISLKNFNNSLMSLVQAVTAFKLHLVPINYQNIYMAIKVPVYVFLNGHYYQKFSCFETRY